MIGHAYLHIAWDLPRVVQSCFTFGTDGQFGITKFDAGLHFRATNASFPKVLDESFGDSKIVGSFALGSHFLKERSRLLNYALLWMLEIRSDAWMLGVLLGEAPDNAQRNRLLNMQWAGIMKASKEARKGTFGWLTFIKPPLMMSVIALPFIWQEVWFTVLYFLAFLAFMMRNYVRYRSLRPFIVANKFGSVLHEEMQRILNPEERFEPKREG